MIDLLFTLRTMNTRAISICWFFCMISPSSVFVIYPTNAYTLGFYIFFSGCIFMTGFRLMKASISQDIAENLFLKVNAIKHNINEALVVAAKSNEPVSLSDSLSIKENLYAIEATVPIRKSSISTHHRKLQPLLSVVLQDYSLLAHSLGITLNVNFSADQEIRILKVDPSLLNKILSIIISNSISVTGKGGKVSVSTELSCSHYSIVVTDFAGGIKPDVLSKLSRTKVRSFGRRVDVHNRIHYGLGFVSLKHLIAHSNISVTSEFDGYANKVIIAISRKVNSIGVNDRALSL